MSGLFDEETANELRKLFNSFKKSLKDSLVLDSLEHPGISGKCKTCPEAKQLALELTRITEGRLAFEILDNKNSSLYRPRYLPAFIYDTRAKNVRFYGLPSGQEFAPFIFTHEYISEGVKLSRNIAEEIESIETPLHIKVFVTPECPYCSVVVDFLNQVGLINSNILVETIEAFENPIEADKYFVQYVPFVAVNRIEEYNTYGANPIDFIPGYVPNEEILEVLKRAEKKIKRINQ
ncbi:MAG: thioredoxin family protein [Desulfurococcaceae archaeon]